MISLPTRARAPLASGHRVFWNRPAFAALVFAVISSGCTTVGADTMRAAGPSEPVDPPIRVGAEGAQPDPTAARLLKEASVALATDPSQAEELAREVVRAHASAQGSGAALRILADVAFAQERWAEAEAFSGRYAALLPAGDDRAVRVRTLGGDAALRDGRPVDALGQWLTIPGDADAGLLQTALQRVETTATELSADELRSLLDGARQTPLIGPVAARLALERYIGGNRDLAARLGRVALDAGATGRSARMAQGAVDGDLSEFVFAPRIGIVLPMSGSPRLRDFAEEILQGIQVAVSEYGQGSGQRLAVELVQRDNRGVAGNGARIISELEQQGVLGVIGPLQEGLLEEAAAARAGFLPIVSPTSPVVPDGSPDVYTIQGAEEGAAQAIARYAIDRGIETAVVIYPDVLEATREAAAFRDAFGESGGTILGEMSYPRGTTYFEEQLQAAAALDPDAVVFPIPAADVELVAPQVTFFGLDSLGIEVLGTNGWTDPDVLARIDPRHTNGVVAASRQPAPGVSPGAAAFREAYERYFSNTLRSSVPAYGYDAARLLLEVIESGARTPQAVARGLRVLQGLEGATGRLSVQAGHITRSHFVVCLQNQRPEDLPDAQRPRWTLFPPLRDRKTGAIPEGATPRIMGFRCPGAPRPPGSLDDLVFHPDSAFIRPDTMRQDTIR